MFTESKLAEVKDFLENTSPESSVYLGCDSMRIKKNRKWFALYTMVIVVHLDSKHGAKLFGYNVLESDHESNPSRPFRRMMNEAYKVVEMYNAFEDELIMMDTVEIHLDINPSEVHGSSCAVKAASGYILGTCGIEPKVKPDAFAASYAADRMVRGLQI